MTANDKLSELLRALSHPHRRVVLYYLREHERASLETLAGCATGRLESGPGRATGVATEYEAVRAQLHHSHLPMLAETGVFTYDVDSRKVRLGDFPAMAETLVSTALTFEAGDADIEGITAHAEE